MAMAVGGAKGAISSINMTPMIDVLLVLIIIFMVITPTMSHGLRALVPTPETGTASNQPPDDIVITVNGDRTVSINSATVPIGDLSERLRRIFVDHPNHPLFVRGGKDLEFEQVAAVIDIARGVGLDRIALMTK